MLGQIPFFERLVDVIIPGISSQELIAEAKNRNVDYNHRKAPLSKLSDSNLTMNNVKNYMSP